MITQPSPVAFSGNIPRYYDAHLGPIFFEPFSIDVAERIGQLKPQNVLELACGTGRLTRRLAESIPAGAQLVATDINPAMIALASAKLADAASITWDVVDAHSLPYPENSFDVVVSQFGAMFYTDKIAAYAETLRALKPGGIFFMLTWDKLENNPVALTAHQTLQHFFPNDPPQFFKIPFSYYNESQIRGELETSGFGLVHSVLITLKGHGESALSVAKGLLQGTPTYTALMDRDETLLEPIMDEVSRRLADQFGTANIEAPVQARLFIAEKPLSAG